MIVDHLLTRTGVRWLGIVIAGVVPLASSYFCYMIAYKELPLHTLLNEIPLVIQLLQANPSVLTDSLVYGAPYLSSSDPLPPSASANSPPSATLSATSFNSIAGPMLPPRKALSPFTSAFVAFVHYLDSHGYRDLSNIPGYHYLIALQPHLNPILSFISSHRTLACIITLLHIWMGAELIFYIMYWKKRARLQEIDRVVKGVGPKERRKELFQRCLETVEEGDGVKRWIEVWFDTGRTKQRARFEEIGRENMIHW